MQHKCRGRILSLPCNCISVAMCAYNIIYVVLMSNEPTYPMHEGMSLIKLGRGKEPHPFIYMYYMYSNNTQLIQSTCTAEDKPIDLHNRQRCSNYTSQHIDITHHWAITIAITAIWLVGVLMYCRKAALFHLPSV